MRGPIHPPTPHAPSERKHSRSSTNTRPAIRCGSTCSPWKRRCAHTPRGSARIPDRWGLTGLVHDFDYERFPNPSHSPTEEHPAEGCGSPHVAGPRTCSSHPRARRLHGSSARVAARQDPLRRRRAHGADHRHGAGAPLAGVHGRTRSVRKKMKDKAFARGVNREDVVAGAADLGVDLDEHIDFVIGACGLGRGAWPGRKPGHRLSGQQSAPAPRKTNVVTQPWHTRDHDARVFVNARTD